MRLLIVSNYAPDRQQSMARFAMLLQSLLCRPDIGWRVELIAPPVVFGGRGQPHSGYGKWLGYIDKYLLFPWWLAWRAGKFHHVHIADHSAAMLIPFAKLRRIPVTVTCHDALAIRGAMGDPTTYCPATRTGIWLQRWILSGLRRAHAVHCVSRQTAAELSDLGGFDKVPLVVVHHALNQTLPVVADDVRHQLLQEVGVPAGQPYLLHVGSNLARKNRGLLIEALAQLPVDIVPGLVLAGEPADGDLLDQAQRLGCAERIFSVPQPDTGHLNALYRGAHALVFPSHSEGFGWPVIEAQACDCPVVASDISVLREVAGADGAVFAPSVDCAAWVAAVIRLGDPNQRRTLIEAGRINVGRFSSAAMCQSLHQFFKVYHNSNSR
jgi:glycosyltransferase involved in cell wall biosynthesis